MSGIVPLDSGSYGSGYLKWAVVRPRLPRYVTDEVDGALHTSLKVMLSGAGTQVLDTGSKLSIRPEPSLLATIRA